MFLKNSVTRPLNAEGREEGEREHDAAELGEHARRGDDQLAERAVRVAPDDRPGEQRRRGSRPAIAVTTASWIDLTKALTNDSSVNSRRDVVERELARRPS